MKTLRMLSLLGILLQSAQGLHAQTLDTQAASIADLEASSEAALALVYRTQLAIETCESLYQKTGAFQLNREIQVLRLMGAEAAQLADDLNAHADEAIIAEHKQQLEQLLLQSEEYRRQLTSLFRTQRDLLLKLADVRRTAYYLQSLLNTPS